MLLKLRQYHAQRHYRPVADAADSCWPSLRCAAFIAGLALASIDVRAEGWVFAPVFTRDDWKAEPTVALIAGSFDPDSNEGDQDTIMGLEVSINCPWLRPPSGKIRNLINYFEYDNGGLKIKDFEINPRYFISLAPGLDFGVGPGFGYLRAESEHGEDASMWSIQGGADLNYRSGMLFLGLGARYQDTRDEAVGIGEHGVDNWLITAKFGINFF